MWCNWNGELVEELSLSKDNRSFRYGDGLFESMRIFNGEIFNQAAHEKRLLEALKVLQLRLQCPVSELFQQLQKLLKSNHVTEGGKARITISRVDGGKYAPISNNANYLIEGEPLASNTFVLNTNGLKVGVYKEHLKPMTVLSTIKTNNALLYVLASIYMQKQAWDDTLLLNTDGRLAEGSSSNLFVVKNGELLTPPLSEGPLAGTMRSFILQYFDVREAVVTETDFTNSDEAFLSNSHGIRWIFGKENQVSQKVISKLNSLI